MAQVNLLDHLWILLSVFMSENMTKTLAKWLCEQNLAISTSEAKRLIIGGAVKVNGTPTIHLDEILCLEQGDTVQVGKTKTITVEKGGQYISDYK